MVCFFFILSHWDLLRLDVGHLLDDCVVNSLGDFIRDSDFFLIRNLVIDGVWYLICNNVWNRVSDNIWLKSAGDVRNLDFNFIWHLSLNGIRDLCDDFIWLKSLNFVGLVYVFSLGDLVWHLFGLNVWDLLSNLIFFSNVVSHIVDMIIIGRIWSIITTSDLSMVSLRLIVWFRLHAVTRVIGVLTNMSNINWNIPCSGFVLGLVEDLLLFSVRGLVRDDGDLSVFGLSDWSVGSLINGVVPGVGLSSVLSLVLDSVLGVEDGVVPDLVFLPVEHLVLVAVPGLRLISVVGHGVGPLEDLDFSPVSVFFLLPVEDFIVRLVGGVGHVLVVRLLVVAVDGSWLEGVPVVVVWSIVDFIGLGVPHLFFGLVSNFDLVVLGGERNLSCPDFLLMLGLDGVFDFVIDDFDVTELGCFTEFCVLVDVFVVNIFIPLYCGSS